MNKEPRLRFTDEERSAPALEKPIRKAEKAAARADQMCIRDSLLEALTNWLKEMLVGGIMSNLSGMFDSVNPVSYTHLDVYKRQAIRSRIPLSSRSKTSSTTPTARIFL